MARWTASLASKSVRLRLAVIVSGCTGLVLIGIATSKSISIVVDGETVAVRTHAQTVSSALREAGLSLHEADKVRPALGAPIDSGSVIEVQRARDVQLDIDGNLSTVRTTLRHPSDILAEAGWVVYPGDRLWVDGLPVGADGEPPMPRPSRVRWLRSITVSLNERGRAAR